MAQRARPEAESCFCPLSSVQSEQPMGNKAVEGVGAEPSLLWVSSLFPCFNPLGLIIQLCLPLRHMRKNLWSLFTFSSCSLHPSVKEKQDDHRQCRPRLASGPPFSCLQHFMDSIGHVKQNRMTSSYLAVTRMKWGNGQRHLVKAGTQNT